jgi:hypothetical protein
VATWNDFDPDEQAWLKYLNPFARTQEPALLNWLFQVKRHDASEHLSVAEHHAAMRHDEDK